MHIKWKSLLPLVGVVAGFVVSPDFLAIIPASAAHIIIVGSTVLQALVPQVFTKKTT